MRVNEMDDINQQLGSTRGGRGRLIGYTASHDRLTVEITEAYNGRRRHLILIGCSSIRMPTLWQIQSPYVVRDGDGFTFVDRDVLVRFAHEAQLRDSDTGDL